MSKFYATVAPHLLSLLRIVFALMILQHGAQKLFGFPGADKELGFYLTSLPLKAAVAGTLETVGGLLLLTGLLVRPAAFVLSGLMASAYFMSHAPGGLFPIVNRGELAVLFCFAFLYLAAAGGGPWSLDRLFRRDEREDVPRKTESAV
jgi:putative oxidoreductase